MSKRTLEEDDELRSRERDAFRRALNVPSPAELCAESDRLQGKLQEHEELKRALKDLLAEAEEFAKVIKPYAGSTALAQARKVLAKVEGE
jgi:predicted transcriptional regulator